MALRGPSPVLEAGECSLWVKHREDWWEWELVRGCGLDGRLILQGSSNSRADAVASGTSTIAMLAKQLGEMVGMRLVPVDVRDEIVRDFEADAQHGEDPDAVDWLRRMIAALRGDDAAEGEKNV